MSENGNYHSLHRYYKSCSESHEKERLIRKALIEATSETDIEGADVT